MAWDKEGDVLGILTDTSSLAILWNINTKNAEQLDTAMGAKYANNSILEAQNVCLFIFRILL